MQKQKFEPLWQDRDIRFDAPLNELSLRSGEKIIQNWPQVEDTKGNSGEVGKLLLTNLRIIWQSLNKPRINLTIGLSCISTMANRMIHTKLRGKNESLYLMTKVNGTRYEFIFICLHPIVGQCSDMVQLVGRVCKAYVQSKLFRDLRLRSAIMWPEGRQLKMLPSEQIYNQINGVWNLSSDQGNLGTMYLTNVRVVWHANINQLFNISLPYIQIRNIKIRDSKFGLALVIESSESSGGYVLGFRVDPVDKLNAVFEELNNLYMVHAANPEFGVHQALNLLEIETPLANNNQWNDTTMDRDNSMLLLNENGPIDHLDETNDYNQSMPNNNDPDDMDNNQQQQQTRARSGHDPVLAYLAEGESSELRPHQWTYNPSIGLSIETIKDGFTIQSLWQVVENNSSNLPNK